MKIDALDPPLALAPINPDCGGEIVRPDLCIVHAERKQTSIGEFHSDESRNGWLRPRFRAPLNDVLIASYFWTVPFQAVSTVPFAHDAQLALWKMDLQDCAKSPDSLVHIVWINKSLRALLRPCRGQHVGCWQVRRAGIEEGPEYSEFLQVNVYKMSFKEERLMLQIDFESMSGNRLFVAARQCDASPALISARIQLQLSIENSNVSYAVCRLRFLPRV
jgi:hypothetical protein